jgi:hypothetical protein
VPKKNEKPRLAAGLFRFLFARSAVLLVLLATLLLLAGLLLSAALLLTTLLLARLLVRILIHFTFLFNIGLKRHFDQSRPWRVAMRGRCICSHALARSTLRQNVFGTWRRPDVFSVTTGEPMMGRYLLLWLLGVPIPILVLIWIFGGLH